MADLLISSLAQEAEIRNAMKRGDDSSARILAKQLVRLREQKNKTQMMKSQITSTGHQAQVHTVAFGMKDPPFH